MSIILELRGHTSHVGVTLVHTKSESVVLGNVFGIVKNLSFDAVLHPWLMRVTGDDAIASDDWGFSFWEKQGRVAGIPEGSTEVDLVLSSPESLVFVEVKLDAAPSPGPAHDPDRDQLVRNLDVGGRRADREGKRFVFVYITPDQEEPAVVDRIRSRQGVSRNDRLFWTSWGSIAEALARSYREDRLHAVEQAFGLDLLAYLAGKGLWQNTVEDDPIFYSDDLYDSLRATDSPYVHYAKRVHEPDESWRQNQWDEAGLRELLGSLRPKDKFLLKSIAQAGGSMSQGRILRSIPFLVGRTSASLRALKSHINASCKGRGKAPILAVGTGTGNNRVHEISPKLGDLKRVVVEVASAFEIPANLLEQED